MPRATRQVFHERSRPSGAPVSEGPASSVDGRSRLVHPIGHLSLYLGVCAFLLAEVVIARSLLFGDVGSLGGMLSELVFVLAIVGVVDLALREMAPGCFRGDREPGLAGTSRRGAVCVVRRAPAEHRRSAVRGRGVGGAIEHAALFQPAYLVFVLGTLAPLAVWWRWRGTIRVAAGRSPLGVCSWPLVSMFACVVLAGGSTTRLPPTDGMDAANSRGLIAYEVASARVSRGGPRRDAKPSRSVVEADRRLPDHPAASVEEIMRRETTRCA